MGADVQRAPLLAIDSIRSVHTPVAATILRARASKT